jgi:hypothetical protein
MRWVPHQGDEDVISNTQIVAPSSGLMGTAVPDGASVNTYGTVTELISAANNTRDSWAIEIGFMATTTPSALAGEGALDILIGGATDDVLINSLLVGGTYMGGMRSYFFPLHIPAGLRIAARFSSAYTHTTDPGVVCTLYSGSAPGGMKSGRKVTTYGTKASNSRGVSITPGQNGAAGSWTQIVASTTEDHFYFMPGFQVEVDTTIASVGMMNVGIGVGAATEERIGTWWFSKNASEQQSGPNPARGVNRWVPSGTRLSMQASVSSTTADSNHGGLIYAVS